MKLVFSITGIIFFVACCLYGGYAYNKRAAATAAKIERLEQENALLQIKVAYAAEIEHLKQENTRLLVDNTNLDVENAKLQANTLSHRFWIFAGKANDFDKKISARIE